MKQEFDKKNLKKLVEQAKHGDTEAYGKIFDVLADDIFRFAYMMIEDRPHAQDITSEAFRKAWLRIHLIKTDNFRAYLYRVARNLTIDLLRKRSRYSYVKKLDNIADGTPSHINSIAKKEETTALYKALKTIPQKYREVIICRYFDNLSVRETSRVTGKSQVSIRVIQYRAIRKLREILTQI